MRCMWREGRGEEVMMVYVEGREGEEEVVVCVKGREGEGLMMMVHVGEHSPTMKYSLPSP